MAFAFPQGFPFSGETCFVRSSGGGSNSVCSSAQAYAGCGGRASSRSSVRVSGGPSRSFDVVDTPEAVVIFFDASGFQREDIKVKVVDGRLQLRATQGSDIVIEKSWNLPNHVVQDGIHVKLSDDNEVTITLPKTAPVSFDVPIQSSEQRQPASPVAAVDANPPHAPAQSQEDQDNQDADGSWVEVDDEDVAQARAKGKAPADAAVLEDVQPGPSSEA